MGQLRLEDYHNLEKPPAYPPYNVWIYNSCDPRFGQKHPGQIPGQAIVNLLLWLTEPFGVVADPMAGGGTTVDVSRYLLRRHLSDDQRSMLAAMWKEENKQEPGGERNRDNKGAFIQSTPRRGGLDTASAKENPTRAEAVELFKVSKQKLDKASYVLTIVKQSLKTSVLNNQIYQGRQRINLT